MPVHQEEIYVITHEFTVDQLPKAQTYLNEFEPVGSTVDWWDNELTLTGFDSKAFAQHFLNEMLEAVE